MNEKKKKGAVLSVGTVWNIQNTITRELSKKSHHLGRYKIV